MLLALPFDSHIDVGRKNGYEQQYDEPCSYMPGGLRYKHKTKDDLAYTTKGYKCLMRRQSRRHYPHVEARIHKVINTRNHIQCRHNIERGLFHLSKIKASAKEAIIFCVVVY